jgi:hypothetical protein
LLGNNHACHESDAAAGNPAPERLVQCKNDFDIHYILFYFTIMSNCNQPRLALLQTIEESLVRNRRYLNILLFMRIMLFWEDLVRTEGIK